MGLSLIIPKVGHPEVRTGQFLRKVKKERESCRKESYSLVYCRFLNLYFRQFRHFLLVLISFDKNVEVRIPYLSGLNGRFLTKRDIPARGD